MAKQITDDFTGEPINGDHVSIRAVRLERADGTFEWLGDNGVRHFQNGATLGAWVSREVSSGEARRPEVTY